MNEVAMLKNNVEFETFLGEFEEKTDKSLKGLISKRCNIMEEILKLDDKEVFSVGQLRQLFELAK